MVKAAKLLIKFMCMSTFCNGCRGEMERAKSVGDLQSAQAGEQTGPGKRPQKRKRRSSSEAFVDDASSWEGRHHERGGGRHLHQHRPPHKKPRIAGGGRGRGHASANHSHKRGEAIVSSKRVAEKIMKTRLGGSVSDPLNLEGGGEAAIVCSSCVPSPSVEERGQRSPPPKCLIHDPLNLEGKVKDFPTRRKASTGEKPGKSPSFQPCEPPTLWR